MLWHSALIQHVIPLYPIIRYKKNIVTNFFVLARSEMNEHLKHAENSATKKGNRCVEMNDTYPTAHPL
jgi:hypothetical protein